MKIAAYAAAEQGGSLHPIQFNEPELLAHQVLIEVSHCGICHSDIHMIDNDWNSSKYPLVPGHEVVGTVVKVGSAVANDWKGKRVGLGWQSGSCGTCEWCMTDNENLCPTSEATIVKRHGGFASHVVASEKFIFSLPDRMDAASMAPLLCGGVTVFSPLHRYNVKKGMRVGVMGIGGLGHLGLQFAKAMGSTVTAISSSPGKQEEAAKFGADEFLISTDPGQVKAAKSSLDFLLITATVDLDWRPYVQMIRPNGTICFVTGEDTRVNIPVSMLLSNQITVTGSAIGSVATMNEMIRFADAHDVKAQVEVLPLKEVNAALTKVRRNQARYRMVLEV